MSDTARIQLRMPANLNFTPIYQTINPNTTFSIQLDVIGGNSTWLDSIENKPADQVLRKGLYLTSDAYVTAYYEVANASNPAVYALKGKNALGMEFYISGQDNYANQTNDGSEAFDIVATEDNTQIVITPTINITGHLAGLPFMIHLNKGETYSARTTITTAAASLKGSHVTSDKPIAITLFDDSIITGGWDEIADQTIPVDLLGLEYIVIKGFADNVNGNNDEHVYILASKDNTEVRIDGNPVPVTTLSQGQQYNYSIPPANNTVLIEATNPVYVYHLSGHPGEAGASLIPQDSCTGSRQVGFNRTSSGTFGMLILCRNGIQDSFYLNGDRTVVTAPLFTPVPGTSNSWVYYRQNNLNTTQVPLNANLLVNTLGKFHLGILNMTGGSSEYGYFSDFSSLYLGADRSICPGDSVVLDAGNFMTSYQWLKLVNGSWSTVGTNRYYSITDSGYYACVVNGDFCTLQDTLRVDLYPAGVVDLGPDVVICETGSKTWDAGPAQSYLWSNSTTSRWLTATTPGDYWVRIVNNNGCVASDTVHLSLDSIPLAPQPITGPATVCQGATGVVYTVPPISHAATYAWTIPPDATGSSTTNSISLDFASSAVNGVVKVKGTNYCGEGPEGIYPITVNPTPHLTNNPLTASQCSGAATAIALTSDVSGAQFTWTATGSSLQVSGFSNSSAPGTSINQSLVNTGNSTETVTYHITPQAAGCNGPAVDYVVRVYPVPNLTNTPASQAQCNNLATGITLTSNVVGTQFTWTASGSSLLVTGFSNSAAPGTSINQTLVNSGYVTETVTYTVSPSANGCSGTSMPYLVTVYPTPDLTTNPLAQSQCNANGTGITLTSNVAGTQFTWTAAGSSPQVSGFSNSSVPGTSINQILVNSGYSIETVTYSIVPHKNGCDGTTYTYTVTVKPTPDFSNSPLTLQMCNNVQMNKTLTSNVAGTTFTWSCTPSSANISGYANNTTPTTLLNQTLVNSGLAVESVVYHMLPTANGCTGTSVDYTVSVVQSPDVYFTPATQTICSEQTSNIQVLSHVPGTSFTWTASASSPSLTGYAAGGGSLIQQTVTNGGNTIEQVTYTAYPTVSGCAPGTPQSILLTVNPKPQITNTTVTFTQCSGATTSITPTATVPGSLYTWTASPSSGNVSGFSNNLTPTAIVAQTLTNSGFNNESVIYQIVPVANGCSGTAVPFTQTVFPIPDVYFTPASQTICPWQSTNIANLSHVVGTTYTWTVSASSANVTGYSAGLGPLIKQTLNNLGTQIETVDYYVVASANGCLGSSSHVIVSVSPAPIVAFTSCFDPITTSNAKPFQLKGGVPINGTYTGSGITGTTFYPALAGVGTHVIEYIYTNQFNCKDTAHQSIEVQSTPVFTCGSSFTDPRDGTSYPTLLIGSQCWFASNLNFGSTITSTSMQRDNCISEKYCYNDNASNCSTKGGLYQWDEVMRFDNTVSGQGLCPPGWHIPNESEWSTLFNQFISNGFAGSPLKYSGYSGFNATLDGIRGVNKSWDFLNFATLYWSSTGIGTTKAWAHGMNDYNPSVSFYPASRSDAFSVRCIKD